MPGVRLTRLSPQVPTMASTLHLGLTSTNPTQLDYPRQRHPKRTRHLPRPNNPVHPRCPRLQQLLIRHRRRRLPDRYLFRHEMYDGLAQVLEVEAQ